MRTVLAAAACAAVMVASAASLTASAEPPAWAGEADRYVMHISVPFFWCGPPFAPCGGKAEFPPVPEGSAIVIHGYFIEANPCLDPRTVVFWGFDGLPGPFDGLSAMHAQIFGPPPEHFPPFVQASNSEIWLLGTDFMQNEALNWRPVIQINTNNEPFGECPARAGDAKIVYSIESATLAYQ
jgi:hypothetical protein